MKKISKSFIAIIFCLAVVVSVCACAKPEEITPIKYSITFEVGGGTAIQKMLALEGETIAEPVAPTKANYNFDGWYTDAGFTSNEFAFDKMGAKNLVLYAKWTKDAVVSDKVIIRFDTNGGVAVDAIKIDKDAVIADVPPCEKAGFTFLGWKLHSSIYNGEAIGQDVTLVAQWTAGIYTFESYKDGYAVKNVTDISGNIVLPTQYLGKEIIKLEDSVFENSQIVGEITVNVQELGDNVFNNSKFSKIILGNKVSKIGACALSNVAGEIVADVTNKNLIIKDGFVINNKTLLSTIKNFSGEVKIPNEVEVISDIVFYGNEDITKITTSATIIGNYAFSGCKNLQQVDFGARLTTIGKKAFFDCSKLSNVILPNTIVEIAEKAFAHCTSITTIDLKNVKILGSSVFDDYIKNNLTAVSISVDNTNYKLISGILYTTDLKTIVLVPRLKTGEIVLPDELKEIGVNSFKDCVNITSLISGANVSKVDSGAFWGCNSLKTISFKKVPKFGVNWIDLNVGTVISYNK